MGAVAFSVAACSDAPVSELEVGLALDAPCGAGVALCDPALVCLDGYCRPWAVAWSLDVGEGADADVENDADAADADADADALDFDIVDIADGVDAIDIPDTVDGETATEGVNGGDSDGGDEAEPDGDGPDIMDAADILPDEGAPSDVLADAEMGPADSAPELPDSDGAAEITDGDVDNDPDGDADSELGPDLPPKPVVLYIKEDTIEFGTSPGLLALGLGQSWVQTINLPKPSRLVGMEAAAQSLTDLKSCGAYTPVVWIPTEFGTYSDAPTWASPSIQALQGVALPIAFLITDGPELPAGPVRFGMRFEALCSGGPPTPVLLADDSGVSGAFWHAPEGTSPWVPADAVGVKGRFALRALIEVSP